MRFLPSGRSVVRAATPIAVQGAFWGSVYYFGPAAVIAAATSAAATVGIVPVVLGFAFINMGGVTIAANLLI